jgi:hypothetical protein
MARPSNRSASLPLSPGRCSTVIEMATTRVSRSPIDTSSRTAPAARARVSSSSPASSIIWWHALSTLATSDEASPRVVAT